MDKTFADLAPDDKNLLRINELAPGKLAATDVALLPMLVIDEQPTVYFTKPGKSWFEAAEKQLNGPKGVSLQLNHDINTLPFGRLFKGKLWEHEGGMRLDALSYTDNHELIDSYLKGKVKDVSAGLKYDRFTCGICGNEWLSQECRDHAKKNKHVTWGNFLHYPGHTYDDKLCIIDYEIDEGKDALREVSPVYKGASAGSLHDPEMAKQLGETIQTLWASNLSEDGEPNDDAVKLVRDKLGEKAGIVEMLWAGETADTDEHGQTQTDTDEHTAKLELDKAELEAEKAELAAENKKLGDTLSFRTSELVASQADVEKEKKGRESVKAQLNVVVGEKEALKAGIAGVLEGVVAAEELEKMSEAEKIETVTKCVQLGMELRKYLVKGMETMTVQLDGGEAGSVEQYMNEQEAKVLIEKDGALRQALSAKYKIPILTVTKSSDAAEKGIAPDARAFKTD